MNQIELIQKFHNTLPKVKEWVDNLLEEYRDKAVPVAHQNFSRLEAFYPPELLRKTKSVVLKDNLPFPPLSKFGLSEFKQMENMPTAGITYKDIFFVSKLHHNETLYFHEMVHVVQWDRLGVDRFLLAYGAGLMQFGYRNSPLEQMAYQLQEGFKNRKLPFDLVKYINQETDAIWSNISSLFEKK